MIEYIIYEVGLHPQTISVLAIFSLLITSIITLAKISVLVILKKKSSKIQKNTKHPKFSIVIPVHNEGSEIKYPIQAALNTNYKNKEIIVIDDNSTDNTYSTAKEFSDKGLIKLLRKKQFSGSKAAALNYGLLYATGDLILCTDAGALLQVDSLQNAAVHFEDHNINAVVGNNMILSGDEGIVNALTKSQQIEQMYKFNIGRQMSSLSKGSFLATGNMRDGTIKTTLL